MFEEFTGLFNNYYESVIFLYSLFLIAAYVTMCSISGISLWKYRQKNRFVDYNAILSSPFAPSVSIIAPAYNESKNIIDNIQGLLELMYEDYEVIIVNDGSTDDTLQKVVEYYEMEPVNYAIDYKIPCHEINAVYKSKNRSFQKLFVIDKTNAGKADALNAGINMSKKDMVVSIDVDCVIERDALLRLVKPFLEESDKTVIAAGGVIKIANSCTVSEGTVEQVRIPDNWWARFQVLEYSRGLFMGRMAWAYLDGLLIISGALGMFNRKLLIECGGYAVNTVGEDMEVVVRMRRIMAEQDVKYTVAYIPDPLCWTEVPDSLPVLARQRNRWTRGTIETLLAHRRIFLNPRYKSFGMLGYTYWMLFEWFAPLFEFSGIMYFLYLIIVHGAVNWKFFIVAFVFIYSFAIALTSWAILFEELTYNSYKRKSDIVKLIFTAFLEPIVFHPLTVIWAIRGNIDYILGKKSWGVNPRHGFTHLKKSET